MKTLELIFIGTWLMLTASDAQAYVDPGSGLLAWQGALALFGALLVYFGRFWRAAKRLWLRIRNRDEGP
jgi:hypothetical protein